VLLALVGCTGGSNPPSAAGTGSGSAGGTGTAPSTGGPSGAGSSAGGSPPSPVPLPTEPDGCVEVGTATVVDAGTRARPLPAVVLGGGMRAVVLVNDRGQRLCGWLPFARTLSRAGLRVVLYDPPAAQPGTALRDITGWLRDRGNSDVAYVGAGSGAATATAAASAVTPPPYAVVALSPAPSAVRTPALYAAASTGDPTGAAVARRLTSAGGRLRLVPGRALGTALVAGPAASALVADITAFLRSR
jgi:hypothetical protein